MEPRVKSEVRRKYDEAFKRHVVGMVVEEGRRVVEVAQELGISPYLIYEWREKFFPKSPGQGEGEKISLPVTEEDLAALHRRIAEQARQIESLTQQREILKKSLGIVCENPNNATGPSSK